jgi:hypothetical protein
LTLPQGETFRNSMTEKAFSAFRVTFPETSPTLPILTRGKSSAGIDAPEYFLDLSRA